MGKRTDAQRQMMELLRRSGKMSVADAVADLNISEATARRHFADLEKRGELIRVFGGVRLPLPAEPYRYSSRSTAFLREKKCIGRAAAELICDHERLFFDSGTTVLELGNALAECFERRRISDLSVVTNSLVYSETLAQYAPITLTGGTLRSERRDLAGVSALQNIERYNFTRAVLGADGISADGVLSATDEETAILAQTALRRSKEALILIDSSKLGVPSFAEYAKLEPGFFTLVTDSGADKKLLGKWQKLGIRIVTAKTK